eukprot:14253148-Ditylum_brightwellii.AAC.1
MIKITMRSDDTIAYCVLAIGCIIRKDAFHKDGVRCVERLLLGSGSNADNQESDIIEDEGGGGDSREKFELTDDSPLYIVMLVVDYLELCGTYVPISM